MKEKLPKIQLPRENNLAIYTPRIILQRNRQAIVEGCERILIYDENMIRLQAKKQEICFYGSGLSLQSFQAKSMIIAGSIDKIEYFG